MMSNNEFKVKQYRLAPKTAKQLKQENSHEY